MLVVDDGSPEPLEPALAPGMGRESGAFSVRFLRVPNGGPARARNLGVQAARGEWIAFTDHDCEPDAGWLHHLAASAREHGDVLLGGPKRNGLPENPYSAAHESLSDFVVRWFARPGHPVPFFTTNNLAMRRESFLSLGGFDDRFPFAHEDRDFAFRWKATGRGMHFVSGAVVTHYHDYTLASFCRQHFRYGQGAADFHRARCKSKEPRPRFEGLRFYSAMLREPWREANGWRAARSSALIALSQALYALGYYSHRRAS